MKSARDPEYIHFIGKHFVALACRQHLPGTTGFGTYCCISGFILSIEDELIGEQWFLVTAGHVIAQMDTAKAHGSTFAEWSLDDTFALDEKRPVYVDGPGAIETIPFDYDGTIKYVYFDEDKGTDFAFIFLVPYYVNLLKSNGVIPFREEHWNYEGVGVADRVDLVGVPTDLIRELNNSGLVSKTLVSLPVLRNDSSPLLEKFPRLLHAYTPDITQSGIEGFEHIRGMSGGPIIGHWKQPDDSVQLRILALQSRWEKGSNTIVAYPAEHFAEQLLYIVGLAKQEYIEHQKRASTEE